MVLGPMDRMIQAGQTLEGSGPSYWTVPLMDVACHQSDPGDPGSMRDMEVEDGESKTSQGTQARPAGVLGV
jgi:hypothetical protein